MNNSPRDIEQEVYEEMNSSEQPVRVEDILWAIKEPVYVKQTADSAYDVERADSEGDAFTILTPRAKRMRINNQEVDLQDHMIDFISLIDEYHAHGGDIGITLMHNPWSDDDDI